MTIVKINDKEYDTDNMSDEAKRSLASLQFVQSKIREIQATLAVYKTSEAIYSKALNDSL